MISIIVPVFNEEENLLEFNSGLVSTIRTINEGCEVIYVDDGSADNSYNLLFQIAKQDSGIKVLRLKRNYGQTFALKAGLDYSKGDKIVFIDSDLQNDPKDIPALLNKLDEGYDIVSGWRKKRKDNLITRVIPSVIANRLISLISGMKLHDMGCSLKAYRRSALQNIDFYGEMHRIIPIYAFNNGARIGEIEVNHNYRKKGKSKYGISRTFKLLLDILSAHFIGRYSIKPMYFFGFIGLFLFLFGFLILLFVTLRVVLFGGIWVSPLLFICIMLLLVGSQVMLMGLLAEILMKLYYQKGPQKPYIIDRRIEAGCEIKEGQ